MKPSLRIAVIAAGLVAAAWPALRAADEISPPPPPPTAPGAAGGEQGPGPRQRRSPRNPVEQAEFLKQTLGLTPEQFDQVLAIYEDEAVQRQAIMSDDSLSWDDRRAKARGLMGGTRVKIRALFTPEQQKKFDALPRPGPWGRHHGPGPGIPPPPPPAGDAPPPPPPPGDTLPANPAPAGGT